MEGALAVTYGVTLLDIWTMSWRRFSILFEHLFETGALSRPDDVDSAPKETAVGQRFDAVTDWNALVGKPPPDKASSVSFNEFMSKSGIQRKVI